MNRELADMRENYEKGYLLESNIHSSPFKQFNEWLEESKAAKIKEPNAFILSTVDKEGTPNSRTVLLKEMDDEGFVFYTNYESDKAKDIERNPSVSMLFLWKEMERQVRIKGLAQKVSRERSLAYFQKRPKGSQIGAWTSPQSQIIPNRSLLEVRQQELTAEYKESDVLPLPEFWGGYIIKPTSIEFWQGRPSRLHDRLKYTHSENGSWNICRLAP